MKKWAIAVALLLAGIGSAVAVAGSTQTVSVCATATTPTHTIAVDGAGVDTIIGDTATNCNTQTYTIPDPVTTTVTQTVTTTAPATTVYNPDPTYASEIAYTQNRPAFTPTRTVNVATASQFSSALSNLAAGDLVKATAAFTVTGETTISKRLTARAVIDLSGYAVKFVYSAGSNLPAVYLNDPSNITIYGGDVSTSDTGGSCIKSYGMQNVVWWGFTAHDCGGTGFSFFSVTDVSSNNDFQGEIWKVGQNLAWDPHSEKGTGLHCVNMDDDGAYAFHDNRLAVYCHDIPTGAAIEYGSAGVAPVNNTIILKAVNLTDVAQTQTGGNALEFWGVAGQGADVKYLEVSNAQGYGVEDGGMNGHSLAGVTVDYGRASNTNLNPRYAGDNPWQTDDHVVYQDVQPTP